MKFLTAILLSTLAGFTAAMGMYLWTDNVYYAILIQGAVDLGTYRYMLYGER